MRRQIPVVWSVWAGSFDDSCRGELTNGDMIGMPIAAIWSKGDHHIGFHAAQVPNNLRYSLGRRSLVQVAIDVIQEIDMADAKHSGGGCQLGLTDLAQCFQAWILLFPTEPAAFPACGGDEVRLDSLGGILGENAAVAERLIITARLA